MVQSKHKLPKRPVFDQARKLLETKHITWWERILLFFKSSNYTHDYQDGIECSLKTKCLFGETYIIKFRLRSDYEKLKKVSKTANADSKTK